MTNPVVGGMVHTKDGTYRIQRVVKIAGGKRVFFGEEQGAFLYATVDGKRVKCAVSLCAEYRNRKWYILGSFEEVGITPPAGKPNDSDSFASRKSE